MPIKDLDTHPAAYVTVADLAAYWAVSDRQIYRFILGGVLQAMRLGPRAFRVRTEDALKFEEQHSSLGGEVFEGMSTGRTDRLVKFPGRRSRPGR